MKYLFVTWGGDRGHDVRFLGHRVQAPEVQNAGCESTPFERAPDSDFSHPETAHGDFYSVDEIRGWLKQSGWRLIGHSPLVGPQSVVVAEVAEP